MLLLQGKKKKKSKNKVKTVATSVWNLNKNMANVTLSMEKLRLLNLFDCDIVNKQYML